MKILTRYYPALPSYFGGKRSHMYWLLSHLNQAIPRTIWPSLVFIDSFMGGGAMTLAAKACGFRQILSNDFSYRSQVIGKALLSNTHQRINRSELLFLLQELPLLPGRIEQTYVSSTFSHRHAQILDKLLYWGASFKNETKTALAQVLLWHCALEFSCFPTSMGTSNRPYAEALDGIRQWDSLNAKRFRDGSVERLLKSSLDVVEAKAKVINKGIFSGTPVKIHRMDALDFLRQAEGDLVYWDPPYAGTLQYERSYSVLDNLLTGKQDDTPKSSFSNSTDALNQLLDASQHIPYWFLSYGNKEIDLIGLEDLVKKHAGKRKVKGYLKVCKHLAHVSKKENNQELLVMAVSEPRIISYAS